MRSRAVKKAGARSLAVAGDIMLAPMVVLMRLPLMAADAQSPGLWGTETALAITEKTAAMAEGVVAAQLSMVGSIAGFWPEIMSGRTPSIFNGAAIERSMHAALHPTRRRVKANFRRLSARI